VTAPRRLTEEDSRARFSELRALWNEYDPIGVSPPPDEYDTYVGPMLRLLEQGTSEAALAAHVKSEVTGHMGLTWNDYLEERTAAFARRCCQWFAERWYGAHP
jgi:hypothetical protein